MGEREWRGGQVCVHIAEKVLRWEEGFVLVAAGSENSKTSVVMWLEGRRKEERIVETGKGKNLGRKEETPNLERKPEVLQIAGTGVRVTNYLFCFVLFLKRKLSICIYVFRFPLQTMPPLPFPSVQCRPLLQLNIQINRSPSSKDSLEVKIGCGEIVSKNIVL